MNGGGGALVLDEIAAAARPCLAAGDAAWFVGGCVRDDLLGRPLNDVDFVVDGDPEAFARRLAGCLSAAVFASSERFSTWRIVVEGRHLDVAGLRGYAESPAGVSTANVSTDVAVSANGGESANGRPSADAADREARLHADLRARDFTVDAIARPLEGGELVDPLGGADDLAARRLRLCSPGALADDPLRVLRLTRLARAYELLPEADAIEAARRAAPGLADVSGERIRDELSATLALERAPAAFRDLAVTGALAVVLPEVDGLRGVGQNPYHHLDVFGHTLEALTYARGVVAQLDVLAFLSPPEEAGLPGAAPLVPLSWAVLLHDVGKPVVREVTDDGRVIFWRHDEIGRRMIADVSARLRFSNRFTQYLQTLVRQHLRLGFLVREQPLTRRALARYRRDVDPWVVESVVVSLCDRLATRGEKTSAKSLARHYRLARAVWSGVAKAPVPQILNGEEVMGLLGITPGPAVGQALEALDEEVEAGEVTSVDEARDFLLVWWGRRDDQGPREGEDAGKESHA